MEWTNHLVGRGQQVQATERQSHTGSPKGWFLCYEHELYRCFRQWWRCCGVALQASMARMEQRQLERKCFLPGWVNFSRDQKIKEELQLTWAKLAHCSQGTARLQPRAQQSLRCVRVLPLI